MINFQSTVFRNKEKGIGEYKEGKVLQQLQFFSDTDSADIVTECLVYCISYRKK